MAESSVPVHHTGFTVRDIGRSTKFYCDHFGGEVVLGPLTFSDRDNEGLSRGVGVPGSRFTIVFISTGNTILELLEYDPPGRDFALSNRDVGAAHVSFQVSDIAAVYERLRASGVPFIAPPSRMQDGEAVGSQFAYCLDPDGIPVELIQVPQEA
jgi:catechol 2,3-dioxygenase-like lactoylglutathione lyase family enzyme